MNFKFDYHKSLEYLHVGCEKPRAYFVPFDTEEGSKSYLRAESERFTSLCGDWDFKFYENEEKLDDFLADGFTTEGFDKLTVPMSWQVKHENGYDTPNYTNVRYPFPLDPPHIPAEQNHCGLYVRSFKLSDAELDGRDIYLNFEGVDSCFYLFVNDEFAAYSQVSHMTTEVNITKYIHSGENTLKVLVFKWCDGTYLEDQDKFRFSGIFREVYLLSRDKIHITDFYVKTELNPSFSQGGINIETEINGKAEVEVKLYAPCGSLIGSTINHVDGSDELDLIVGSPKLWSDEDPKLYTLVIRCGNEYITQHIGMRRYEIRDRVVYVNGKKVKAKGVNRHDSHPLLGSATPTDHMWEDLMILKRHNVNMIRTSHYPNDPRFLEMCDRAGMLVCDETDLETHGMQPIGWDGLTNSSDWTEAYLDRAVRMFERDKNRPCVIFWSLGNESGIGQNQKVMADYLHRRNPENIVHCEDISRRIYNNGNYGTEFEPYNDVIEVESYMYPSLHHCNVILSQKNNPRPLFLCEYSHAMGNGPGNFKDYWDLIYANDCFFGGCVWEFLDHSVAEGDDKFNDPHYTYGGDYGDFPHDGNFCVDGLVYPDRRPHQGLLEFKQVIKPFAVTLTEGGNLSVKNLRYFKDLSDTDLYWSVEKNGKIIKEGRIAGLNVKPQTRKTYKLDVKELAEENAFVYLNISVRSNRNTPWAPVGYELGFEQIVLSERAARPAENAKGNDLCVCENDREIVISDKDTVYKINKLSGLVVSICDKGREMLASSITPAIWRAPTDNDMYIKREWYGAFYDKATTNCRKTELVSADGASAVVAVDLVFSAPIQAPILRGRAIYTVLSGNGIKVEYDFKVRSNAPVLPRFGAEFKMTKDSENVVYFGRGDAESYADKRHASRIGVYKTTATDNFEHYVRPQENMAHTDTKWLKVSTPAGHGLVFLRDSGDFSFNCCHFTAKQLTETKHDYELVPIKETVVNIDYKHNGIGSNSCGPGVRSDCTFSEKEIHFSFRILPALVNNVCPFKEI